METIKRYSMRMGNMGKDMGKKEILPISLSVPERFLETPGRKKMRFVLHLFGMPFFFMTSMAILGVLAVWIWGDVLHKGQISSDTPFIALSILNFFNLLGMLGMLAELAGDSGGTNWFARGFLLSIVIFFSSFFIIGFINML